MAKKKSASKGKKKGGTKAKGKGKKKKETVDTSPESPHALAIAAFHDHYWQQCKTMGIPLHPAITQLFQDAEGAETVPTTITKLVIGMPTLTLNGLHILLDALLLLPPGLVRLDFHSPSCGDAGILVVSKVLNAMATLKTIQIIAEPFTAKGCTYLGQAIATHESLTELVLDYSPIGPDGVIALAQGIQSSPSLQSLSLAHTELNDSCTSAIGHLILAKTKIQ